MKKYMVLLMFAFALASCTKEIFLETKSVEKQIVVNCLFSEDARWTVYLNFTRNNDEDEDPIINNATVLVISGKDTVKLTYQGSGIYAAEEYPVKGKEYTLNVCVDGYDQLSASNSIPEAVDVSSVNFEHLKTTYFFSNDLVDYEVSPLSFKIKSNISNYLRLRAVIFYPADSYIRYYLPGEAIDNLRHKGLPEDFLFGLKKLTGRWISKIAFNKKCMDINGGIFYQYGEDILAEAEIITVDYRSPDAFENQVTLSDCNWVRNVSTDPYTVLGELDGEKEANLYIEYVEDYDPGTTHAEYWIEVVSMDEDYYRYQESYIKQVLQLENPYADAVQIHSNITNGVGIFAGYNRQMIHFFDY